MLLANNQKSDFPITELPGPRRAPPEQTAQGNIE